MLFGGSRLDFELNKTLLTCWIEFTLSTERFGCRLIKKIVLIRYNDRFIRGTETLLFIGYIPVICKTCLDNFSVRLRWNLFLKFLKCFSFLSLLINACLYDLYHIFIIYLYYLYVCGSIYLYLYLSIYLSLYLCKI